MSIKPEAFIAIEETMAHTVGLEWYRAIAPYLEEIIDLIGRRQWSQAHMLIDSIRFDAVVDGTREAVEELSVSAVLFGAQNAAGSVAGTSIASGKQPLPVGFTQALDHLAIVAERNSAEIVRNQLHSVIAALEEEEKLVAIGKEDMSQADLDVAGRLNPEQDGIEKKTLYVHRALVNSAELVEWAKAQGFASTLEQGDFHVTVCFSREPLEWPHPGAHAVEVRAAGGTRRIEQFGKAIVLTFDSSELQSDHHDFRHAGASFDFPDYRPHVTITYDATGVDLKEIEPFEGELVFGPEVFAEVKEDWSDNIAERVLKADGRSLAQMLNAAVLEGRKMVDIGANLTTSRLVSLGFLAEAVNSEITTYQVSEVLDDVTCDVCRHMHGKIFNVGQEYSRLMTVLATSDPSELKHLAPWPKNTKAGLAELRGMTPEEMQVAGYGSPPYHPGCRGFLVLVGTVTEETPMQGFEISDLLPLAPALDGPVAATAAVEAPAITLSASLSLSMVTEARLRRHIASLRNEVERQNALQAYADGGAEAAKNYLASLTVGS